MFCDCLSEFSFFNFNPFARLLLLARSASLLLRRGRVAIKLNLIFYVDATNALIFKGKHLEALNLLRVQNYNRVQNNQVFNNFSIEVKSKARQNREQ